MNVQTVEKNMEHLWSGLHARVLKHGAPFRSVLSRLPRLRVPGFRFAETMSGTATMNGKQHDMVFRLSAEAPSLIDYVRDGRTHIAGTITIDGVASDAPLRGELWIHLMQRVIRYEFSFRGTEGKMLMFTGQKDLQVLHPMKTLKNLPGDIRDDHGKEVAHTKLRFRTRDLPSFLYSFRPLF